MFATVRGAFESISKSPDVGVATARYGVGAVAHRKLIAGRAGGFGQEGISVGAAAALGESDVIITTHRPHAQHVGTDAPAGPVIAGMLIATAGV